MLCKSHIPNKRHQSSMWLWIFLLDIPKQIQEQKKKTTLQSGLRTLDIGIVCQLAVALGKASPAGQER